MRSTLIPCKGIVFALTTATCILAQTKHPPNTDTTHTNTQVTQITHIYIHTKYNYKINTRNTHTKDTHKGQIHTHTQSIHTDKIHTHTQTHTHIYIYTQSIHTHKVNTHTHNIHTHT